MSNRQLPSPTDLVTQLHRISHESIRKDAKTSSHLYLAALGLLTCLKSEQAKIRVAASKQEPCPPPTDTPVMTAVRQDARLLSSLLKCLKTPPDRKEDMAHASRKTSLLGSLGGGMAAAGRVPGSNFHSRGRGRGGRGPGSMLGRGQPNAGRKRLLSEDFKSNKAAKVNLSPGPKSKRGAFMSSTPSMKAKSDPAHLPKPEFSLQPIVCTILFVSFQHLEHWPAALVDSYAEDAFGPRLWVDDDRCKDLCQNLALVHSEKGAQEAEQAEGQLLLDAQSVSHFYNSLLANVPPLAEDEKPTTTLRPAERMRSRSEAGVDLSKVPLLNGDDSDSDSGEEEIVEESTSISVANIPSVDLSVTSKVTKSTDVDNSSSSGEEEIEEEGIGHSSSFENQKRPTSTLASSYPLSPSQLLNLERVRLRYFGENLSKCHASIESALIERLDQKSKQNARLLQALPEFTYVPAVRRIAATHLGKWLQHPGLSMEARKVFKSTVGHMKDCSPPLDDDLDAINDILEMELKANLLNDHIEGITNIVRRIPSTEVAQHVFLKLLRDELSHLERDPHQALDCDHLKKINAVHSALPDGVESDGLGTAILKLLLNREGASIDRIRLVIRRLSSSLGTRLDCCKLIESLISFDVPSEHWTIDDEEDRGRVLLECMCQLVPLPEKSLAEGRGKQARRQVGKSTRRAPSPDVASKLRKKLRDARKFLVSWCCNDYGSLLNPGNKSTASLHEAIVKRTMNARKPDAVLGAGTPDFSSILDGRSQRSDESTCPDAIKCMLLMVEPDSSEMTSFLGAVDSDSDQEYRLRQCYEYGADLDTDALWIVLEAAQVRHSISSKQALVIIEHLLWCCNKDRNATLNVTEPLLIAELYKLAEFVPPKRPRPEADDMDTSDGSMLQNGNSPDVPKLAHPGLWWRITSILLILSGSDASSMGATLSGEYPTLLALIKMATSGRYRFPTVDCDDELRDRMKKEESKMREEEARVAELLFLPPAPKMSKKKAASLSPKRGARASARQRERQDKLRKQKLAKEAAEAAAAATKRRKLLKAAQKTIMVWDPRSPARKPPRESVDLILSVERLFGLSKAFQEATQPDFVTLSVGQTTRDAIERASAWLIPVISSLPSIIGRLPASSSCYLLLQAYGGAGEKASGMKELSAPLLEHVSKTVVGEYGQKDSISAVRLLLTDVADKLPERRRCARRVFQETLSDLNAKVEDRLFDAHQGHTWLLGLLLIEHASSLIADAIELISLALSYERGSVLRALVLSLERYLVFAASKGIEGEWSLPATLCHLVADRPITCSAAIEKYADLRDLVVSVIHNEFKSLLKQDEGTEDEDEDDDYVEMKPSRSFERPADMTTEVVKFPLDRLESIFVLLSIWADDEGGGQASSKKSIGDFTDFMLLPDAKVESDELEGISGAVFAGTTQAAVSVSQWVMLAKSKSDDIARRAALSAPTRYLPRLLLCSGLPRASLLTMIDRLGILGEEAKDKAKSFRDLFMPSAMSDWGISHVGGRKDVARKLLGRLSSYLSDVNLEEEKISSTFIVWLNGECQNYEKSKKPGVKKRSKASKASSFDKLATVSSVLQSIDGMPEEVGDGLEVKSSTEKVDMSASFTKSEVVGDDIQQRVNSLCQDQLFNDIDGMVQSAVAFDAKEDSASVVSLLKALLHLGLYSPRSQAPVARWIPKLFNACGIVHNLDEVWKLLFSARWDDQLGDTVVSLCASSFATESVEKCHEWILGQGSEINGDFFSLRRIVYFLVSTSSLSAPYQEPVAKNQVATGLASGLAKRVDEVALVALRAASWECDETPMHKLIQRISCRNDIPSWMLLLLQLGRLGKTSVSKIIAAILTSISSTQQDSALGLSLQAITLRLYTLYPTSVSLGNAALRTVLVAASKSLSTASEWRCPFDAQIDDTLEALKDIQHSPRLINTMVDLAKSHPLLLLRRLGQMKAVLASDAEAEAVVRPGVRTRILGESLAGPLTAAGQDGKLLKVKLRHWGYAFTDPLWVGMLDILVSVPREVLFECGMAMGMSKVLLEYVKLLYVQSGLNNKDRASRLKGRFAEFLHLLEESSPDLWNEWLAEKDHPGMESIGCTRNMLVTASLLTPEQAIANIRSRGGGEAKK